MPGIAQFAEITIYMYYREHPPAHLHVVYGEYEVTIELATGQSHGVFPYRKLSLVRRWMALHREALAANWLRAIRAEPLAAVAPLKGPDGL